MQAVLGGIFAELRVVQRFGPPGPDALVPREITGNVGCPRRGEQQRTAVELERRDRARSRRRGAVGPDEANPALPTDRLSATSAAHVLERSCQRRPPFGTSASPPARARLISPTGRRPHVRYSSGQSVACRAGATHRANRSPPACALLIAPTGRRPRVRYSSRQPVTARA